MCKRHMLRTSYTRLPRGSGSADAKLSAHVSIAHVVQGLIVAMLCDQSLFEHVGLASQIQSGTDLTKSKVDKNTITANRRLLEALRSSPAESQHASNAGAGRFARGAGKESIKSAGGSRRRTLRSFRLSWASACVGTTHRLLRTNDLRSGHWRFMELCRVHGVMQSDEARKSMGGEQANQLGEPDEKGVLGSSGRAG